MGNGDEARSGGRRDRIRHYIAEELLLGDVPDLDGSTDILSLLDSQALMQLVTFIEDDLSIDVGELDIAPENFRTLADIERFVDTKTAGS